MERSFLEYAMSVIVSRALPDARDGLKPVHRRILWGMHDMGARSDRPRMKCARVSGEVMGKYHPHGESSIYDALVRMAQPFSLRDPLIDFHGNLGSPDFPAAASRYTECRLAQLANEMLAGIDEDTVDFEPNYTNEFEQPTVLPSRFPNLLVNGSQAIAVGMATNIPPHNLGEIIDATIHLIDNPSATRRGPDEVRARARLPDRRLDPRPRRASSTPTAPAAARSACGPRPRSKRPKTGVSIVVTELPYQASINAITTRIAELVNNKELDGIRSLDDLSAGIDTRLVIGLKRDANALVVLNNLFKHTQLQTSFGVNMVALVDGIPRTLNLKQALEAYVDHQVDVITRRSEFRLRKAQGPRAHRRRPAQGARHDRQDHQVGARIGRPRRGARRAHGQGLRVQRDPGQPHPRHDDRSPHAARSQRARGRDGAAARRPSRNSKTSSPSPTVLRGVIKTEMGEIRTKFATERRAIITHDPGELGAEDFIDDEDLVFLMTRAGYVKTVAAGAFRTQGRGGRGIAGAKLKEEDLVSQVIHTTAHAFVLFFSNRGRVFRFKAHEIPMKERTARGTPVINLLPLEPEEKIQAVIATRDYPDDKMLLFATKKGIVKKTPFSEYDKSRREGFIAITLKDGDELVTRAHDERHRRHLHRHQVGRDHSLRRADGSARPAVRPKA